jgi:hypothetical protein
MKPTISDRSVQTVIANLSVVAIGVAGLVYRPEVAVFGTLITTLLAINGYEAVKQSRNGREKK